MRRFWATLVVLAGCGRPGASLPDVRLLDGPKPDGGALVDGAPIDAGPTVAPVWRQIATTAGGPPRDTYAAMAFDPISAKFVLLAGGETWLRDAGGTSWIASGAPTEAPTYRPCLVFDGAQVIRFGGYRGNAPVDETLAWDGAAWVALAPLVSPPARWDAACAHDSVNDRVLVFGGNSAAGLLADTWAFEAGAWLELTPGTGPSARLGTAMAFDGARSRAVLFGGNALDEAVWEFDGTAWSSATPAVRPPPRGGAQAMWDAGLGAAYFRGGVDGLGGAIDDLWRWDGTTWVDQSPGSVPSVPIVGAASAWDPIGDVWLSFGGSTPGGGPSRGSTWRWSPGSSRQRIEDSSEPPAFFPFGGGAFDALRGEAVLTTNGEQGTETYAISAAGWRRVGEATAMPWRDSSPAYDPVRDRVVLFGGSDAVGSALADTWEWDGSVWEERFPLTSPSPRGAHALAHDPVGGGVLLFGGYDGSALAGTWRWTGTEWVDLTPALEPPARAVPRMATDQVRGRIVLFGGFGAGFLDDVWEWDGVSWADRSPPGDRPEARLAAGGVYDPARGASLFAGGGGNALLYDTWAWDGTGWTLVEDGSTVPPMRQLGSLFFDPTSGLPWSVVGDGSSVRAELWTLGPP